MPKLSLEVLLDHIAAYEHSLQDSSGNVLKVRQLAELGEALQGQAVEYVLDLQGQWGMCLDGLKAVTQDVDRVAAAVQGGDLGQLRALLRHRTLIERVLELPCLEATEAVAASLAEEAPQVPVENVPREMPIEGLPAQLKEEDPMAVVTDTASEMADVVVRPDRVPADPLLVPSSIASVSYRSPEADLQHIVKGRTSVEALLRRAADMYGYRSRVSKARITRKFASTAKASKRNSETAKDIGRVGEMECPVSKDGQIPELSNEARAIPATEVHTEFWAEVERGNLASAYWLAVAGAAPVPAWILKACFLASFVNARNGDVGQALSQIVNLHPDVLSDLRVHSDGLSDVDRSLLVAIAAIRPSLITPDDVISLWVEGIEDKTSPIAPVLDLVLPLVRQGVTLDLAYAADADAAVRCAQQAQHYAGQASRWMQTQTGAQVKHPPTRQTLQRLVSDNSEIGLAVRAVADNRHDQLRFVQQVLHQRFLSNDLIDREVLRQAALADSRITHLPSNLMDSLRGKLLDVRSYLKGWAEAVGSLPTVSHDWRREQTRLLREGIEPALARVSATLQEASGRPCTKALTVAFLSACERWVREFCTPEANLLSAEWDLPTCTRELRRPLLRLSDVVLSGQEPLPEELPPTAVAELTGGRPVRALHHAIEYHMQSKNYAMALLLAGELEPESRMEYADRIHDASNEEAAGYRRAVAQLRHQLDSATIDHVLLDEDRSALEGEVLSLEARTFADPSNFGAQYQEISRLAGHINGFRNRRAQSLEKELSRLRGEMAIADAGVSSLAEDLLGRVERSLKNGALALADEYLSQVEDLLSFGLGLSDEPIEADASVFDTLSSKLQPWYDALLDDSRTGRKQVMGALIKGQELEGLFEALDLGPERQLEVSRALEGFKALLARPDHRTEGRHALWVMSLLRFMGFESPDPDRIRVERSWWQYRVAMTDGGLAPLPHFGSARNGAYDLIIVWDRPGVEGLNQIIQAAGVGATCPILLYMGLLSERDRSEWGRQCFTNQLTALLVDELLVCFLATLPSHRLRSTISCAMAWGYANPYTPFGANVPSEVFKGRQPIIQDLISPHGATIIFGGRQLGKSAILRTIVRRFHDSDQEHYVMYEDVKNLGDPATDQPVTEVWRLIRDWAARQKLISANVLDTGPNVTSELLKVLERQPQARILLLLDEADRFLETDATKNFEEIGHLKRLMEASGRRIKVVLSGLHGVGRFCGTPNHPFAQFGTPVNLKPLTPKEAQALIRDPLQALGYRFESDDVVFRIMAYTNNHPALVQHFCQQLLRPRRQSPPYILSLRAVEEVYRRREVRNVMRERFEWTVGLDARYEILVYCIILDQLSERDGYRKRYSVSDVLSAVRAWSSEHAASLPHEVAKSLLDELVGLAVLVRMEDGTYRLRNGNVVRALGSDTEIMELLDQAVRKPLSLKPDPHRLWAALPDLDRAWSPLTLGAESALFRDTVGFHMIFGSRGLGLDHLEPALRRLVRRGETGAENGGVFWAPPECVSVAHLQSYLEQVIPQKDAGRFLIAVNGGQLIRFGTNPDQVVAELQSLLQRRRSSRKRSVQLIAVFDPVSTLAWCKLPLAERTAAQARASSVAVCSTWGREMVERYLNRYEMICTGDVAEAVFRSTNGWPVLVEALHDTLGPASQQIPPHVDPRAAAGDLEKALGESNSSVAVSFLESAGFTSLPHSEQIARRVCENDGVLSASDITPALLGVTADPDSLVAEVESAVCLGLLRDSAGGLVCDPILRMVLGL